MNKTLMNIAKPLRKKNSELVNDLIEKEEKRRERKRKKDEDDNDTPLLDQIDNSWEEEE